MLRHSTPPFGAFKDTSVEGPHAECSSLRIIAERPDDSASQPHIHCAPIHTSVGALKQSRLFGGLRRGGQGSGGRSSGLSHQCWSGPYL